MAFRIVENSNRHFFEPYTTYPFRRPRFNHHSFASASNPIPCRSSPPRFCHRTASPREAPEAKRTGWGRTGRQSRRHVGCSSVGDVASSTDASLWSSIERQFRCLSQEWRQLLPMCSLFFLMAFINTLINSLALSLVMTSEGGGAVVIPFLNVYAVLPASVIFTLGYAYASHHISRNRLFDIVIGAFGLLVAGFTFGLYPNHTTLHLHTLSDQLSAVLPSGFAGAIGMIRNWTFTLFYSISELWGDVGLSLLFWGFANEITHVDSAPVLYPLFGIGANLAQMVGGIVLRLYSSLEFSVCFKAMTTQMLGCMVLIVALHHWIARDAQNKASSLQQTTSNGVRSGSLNGSVGTELTVYPNGYQGIRRELGNGHVLHVSWRGSPKKADSGKRSFGESLRTLSQSPQIQGLAIMTVAQSLSVTLMEFLWKVHLRMAYPTPEAFTGFMGDVSTALGAVTGFLMLASPMLFQKLKWREVANITPNILTWGGMVFFGACLAFHLSTAFQSSAGTQLMMMPVVLGGSLLFVLSRGSKFSLFKPAEEMVYLELDEESRTKGKAAVDVVGAQVGKSGGSILQQVLLMASGGSLLKITPFMIGLYFYMLALWKRAVAEIAGPREQLRERPMDVSSDATCLQESSTACTV